MKIFKWGIIGPGSIAKSFAKDLALDSSATHVIASVLGHEEESTREFAGEHNAGKYFTSLEDFLASGGMDGVYIATPHTLHHGQCLACLQHKLPVLCEKPITINAGQLEQLVKASADTNTFLMEGMWIRFLPSIEKVLQVINEGVIGELISVKAKMSFRAPYAEDSRYFNPELGGGSLLDLGIYPVFLSTLLLGKPLTVKAVAAKSDKGIDEACSILLDYPDKQFAVLESSLIEETDLVAEITGKKGKIKILSPWNETPEGIEVDIYEDKKIVYPCQWEGRGFQFEVQEMMQCLENNRQQSRLMPLHLSLQVMQIMDEARAQADVKYSSFE